MSTTFNLKTYVSKALVEAKDKHGMKYVVENLQPFFPDEKLSVQKVGGWIKKNQFPPEVYEAIAARDFSEPAEPERGIPEPSPEPPARTAHEVERREENLQPRARKVIPEQIQGEEDPRDFVDQTGGSVANAETAIGDPSAYALRDKTGKPVPLVRPARVEDQRHIGIKMKEIPDRSLGGPQPESMPHVITEDLVNAVASILENRGWRPPQETTAVRETHDAVQVPPPGRRPEDVAVPSRRVTRADERRWGRAGDDWNTPPAKMPVIVRQG